MLTEKDYCDYNTCVALKEFGYPTKMTFIGEQATIEIPINSGLIQLYEAQKWLRENKNIHVQVIVYSYTHLWYYTSIYHDKILITLKLKVDNTVKMFNSYEEALLEGIKEAVKILKEEKL